jgi:hypothetical protein
VSSTLRQLQRLRARHGIEVSITRGSESFSLVAVPAKSTAKLSGSDGSFSVVTIEDWLIAVADWQFTGVANRFPRKGDEISIFGSDEKYLVTHPDQNTPVYANFNSLDRPAVAWRIHSMLN